MSKDVAVHVTGVSMSGDVNLEQNEKETDDRKRTAGEDEKRASEEEATISAGPN